VHACTNLCYMMHACTNLCYLPYPFYETSFMYKGEKMALNIKIIAPVTNNSPCLWVL
jgi:hypothetical protein